MKSDKVVVVLGAVCAVAVGSFSSAQTFVIGSDVRPRVEAGKIVADAVDDGSGQLVPNVQFFGYRFQTDPFDPYFVQDPGFNAIAGSGLPPSSQLGFNVVRHLAYWDGTGAVSFTVPPSDEALRFSFGAASVTISGNSGPQSGFPIGNISQSGGIHRHLNAFLLGSDSTTNPTNGVYFTNIRLTSSDASVAPSDSLYIVYNNGASEPAFQSALGYLINPIPGDANFDGRVNLADFNILAANFGQSDRFWYQGDFNRDGVVNLQDFNLLAANFGHGGGLPSPVPEPALAGIVVLGAAALLRIDRRAR